LSYSLPSTLRNERPRWWTVDGDDIAESIFDDVTKIEGQNRRRRADDALFMEMYGAQDLVGTSDIPLDASESLKRRALAKLKFNLCGSVVNTAAAHIASKRPKVKFQTDDADWGLTRKAQSCEQVVKGVFAQNGAYELGRQAFIDSGVSSLGAVVVFSEEGRVKLERCFPGEILVDVREGYYGKPRTIYRVRMMDRQVLQEYYGSEIPMSSGSGWEGRLRQLFKWADHDQTLDQVALVQSWRLGCEDKPGKYAVAVPGKLLEKREYKRSRFPIAFLRWETRQVGFYGQGIVEELRGHQRALNYLHLKIADAIHFNSRSNFVVFDGPRDGPKVSVHHINNDPATVYRVPSGGTPPMQLTANGVPTEWFSYRREIIEDGYAQIGLNQLRATGQVPRGVESGAAIREIEDTGSKRWITKTQAFEQFFLDLGRIIIDEMREMAERGELKPVKVSHRKGARTKIELIDWKEVALDDDQYELDLTPASSLPDSTAGRTQTVEDWYAAGFISIDEAKALLDFPDLERFKSLDLSAHDIILDTIERIIEEGEYFPPEPTDDIELAIKLCTFSVNKFRLRRLDPEKIELLYLYLDDLRSLFEQAQQPVQTSPEQAAAGAAPTPAAAGTAPVAAEQVPAAPVAAA